MNLFLSALFFLELSLAYVGCMISFLQVMNGTLFIMHCTMDILLF